MRNERKYLVILQVILFVACLGSMVFVLLIKRKDDNSDIKTSRYTMIESYKNIYTIRLDNEYGDVMVINSNGEIINEISHKIQGNYQLNKTIKPFTYILFDTVTGKVWKVDIKEGKKRAAKRLP